MSFDKSVRLVANRSIGRSITRGRTYIGYPNSDGSYSVETNYGQMKEYTSDDFRVKSKDGSRG